MTDVHVMMKQYLFGDAKENEFITNVANLYASTSIKVNNIKEENRTVIYNIIKQLEVTCKLQVAEKDSLIRTHLSSLIFEQLKHIDMLIEAEISRASRV